MNRELKKKRTLRVKRMYEPDRMAPINLQVAYEQVVPPRHYRLLITEQGCEKLETFLQQVEEEKV